MKEENIQYCTVGSADEEWGETNMIDKDTIDIAGGAEGGKNK